VKAALNVPTSNERVNVPALSKARIGIISGVVCIGVWALGAFAFNAPGYIHLLLSVGMFLLMWGIVS
jgi:hypothetical protein